MSAAHGPMLEVNLAAIARNWGRLRTRLAGKRCAAVVKADAYGLGAKAVAPALYEAGCQDFFVATLEEGVALREVLSSSPPPSRGRIKEGGSSTPTRLANRSATSPVKGEVKHEATIFVFHGVRMGEQKEFLRHKLMPVLNHSGQIALWKDIGPSVLHVDTGMNRLGVTLNDLRSLPACKPQLIMSHLACANEQAHEKNPEQLRAFRKALKFFPGVEASLANSSGIYLGKPYHFDLGRPGSALYGISPDLAHKNPMEHVATLSAPVLQYRHITGEETVGYGGMGKAKKGTVLATVEIGYADGFLRSLSGRAFGYAAGVRVPIAGRVSMDMVSIDVTAVPERERTPDLRIIFIGKEQPVDVLAKEAGTIGYEIFTRLGSRVRRV